MLKESGIVGRLCVFALAIAAFSVFDSIRVEADTATNPTIAQYGHRTVNISKSTCPNSSCAVLKAEKANPGWKVVSIKEMSATWHITMKN